MTYQDLDHLMQNRTYRRKKLENNTYALRHDDNRISIRLHKTDIINYYAHGQIEVNTAGWQTVTTKDRLNAYLPSSLRLTQERRIWYWVRPEGDIPYMDGDYFTPTDNPDVYTLKPNPNRPDPKALNKLRNQIRSYAKLCAEAVPLSPPSGGDCWYCSIRTMDNGVSESLGDAFKDTEHLLSHMEEKYVVPSLVLRAQQEEPHTPLVMCHVWKAEQPTIPTFENVARQHVQKAVTRFLCKRFGLAK